MLRAREPGIAIDVTHRYTVDQLRLLRDGELDLGIVFDPDDDPDLELEPLFPGERLAACLPAGHRLAGRRVIGPADLHDETLVCGGATNPGAYERALDRFAAAGYRFRRVEDTGAASGRDLVFSIASGRGIAFAPPSLEELGDAHDEVILRPLDPPVRMPVVAVVWTVDTPPGLTAILGTVRAIARELYESNDQDGARLVTGVLTGRQLDVLRLLAEGKSTREIADDLSLRQTTVRNHVAGLIAALGVHTRLQAVIAGKRAGLLEL
jgi:DNA-binding transcriptional LysR family regulator/DNA-binding CsgD family transcriptional regulator